MLNRFRYILLFGIMLFISLRSMSQLAMPDNVCIGAVKHYYVDPNPVPGSTYTWWINGVVQTASITNAIDITWNTTGIHTLEVQELSADGCLGPLRSGQVFVSPLPTLVVGSIVQPTCTVSTGSVILSGLPEGNWTINPGALAGSGTSSTISGLAAATYNFTVTDENGCTSLASDDVVIDAQPSTPSSPTVSTSTPGNVCPVETVNLITLVTSVTPTGGIILFKTTNDPSGIDVTDPTAVGTGSYYLFYQNQEGCYSTGIPVTVTVNPCTKTLNLTSVILQGLYTGGANMRQAYDEFGVHWPAGVADHITVELHSATNYSTIVYSASDVPLSTTGSATVIIPATYNDTYYITIRHRNSLQTVSATAESFSGSTIEQSFGSPANVFGGNLVQMPDLSYAIYSGDVNQDDIIDLGDSSPVDNQAAMAGSGYIPEDINGDGLVDLSDFVAIDNNAAMAIGAITP